MIPLYAFLEGDTIGLLMLTTADETLLDLSNRLVQAASVRVTPISSFVLEHDGKVLDLEMQVGQSPLKPLDRIDVRRRPTEALPC